jgi:hypothetical protein
MSHFYIFSITMKPLKIFSLNLKRRIMLRATVFNTICAISISQYFILHLAFEILFFFGTFFFCFDFASGLVNWFCRLCFFSALENAEKYLVLILFSIFNLYQFYKKFISYFQHCKKSIIFLLAKISYLSA